MPPSADRPLYGERSADAIFRPAPTGRLPCRHSNANLRTYLASIICWADLEPWPKLFQNLRSTRETELAEEFPLHVVCAWIGNSQPIAAKHYLQVTDEHFRQAVAVGRRAHAARPPSPLPSDLADAWTDLPEHVKSAIMALAGSGGGGMPSGPNG